MAAKETGILGEKIAEKYLLGKGYKILARNFSFSFSGPKRGEIDIIAEKDKKICFVEVKAVVLNDKIPPETKVNFIKQRKIIRAAQYWLMKNKINLDAETRLEVVSVIIDPGLKKAKIRHIKNIGF